MGAFPEAGSGRGGGLFELRRTTFETPEFRGVECIEVECKTILNRVVGGMPFEWTINPYRGCLHACSYCLGPETAILLADGRTRPIADLRVGDEIIGTEHRGDYRRYVRTRVLDHWSTVRRAHRVRLADGTELIASADHRFLTERGWKHVAKDVPGAPQRPYLTTNNKLLGMGSFVQTPKPDAEYEAGYLCGMLRGGGSVGSSEYRTRGRLERRETFRLALADGEALERTRGFLDRAGVATDAFLFASARAGRREVRAIRTQRRSGVQRIRQLLEWPSAPSDAWRRGFLAGIFDAEGSCSRGALRFSNADPAILGRTMASLERFGFRHVLEPGNKVNAVRSVRLLGGLPERNRFFLLTDPAISRKRSIEGAAVKSNARLQVCSIEDLGIEIPMYDITTGTGDFIAEGVISHNCFARATHPYLDLGAGRDFETKIVVKVNAAAVLRKQLRAKRWSGEHVAMGTGTDPYQRVEGRYRLMPSIIQLLTEHRNPFSILTKGTLILRDLELLARAAEVTEVATAFSIGTLDEEVWRRAEPGTPHPKERIRAVAELNAAGVPCGVMLAPVMPGINDRPEQLRAVVEAAIEAGATHVSPILLHLRPVVREEYLAWLEREYPDLLPLHERMYARSAYGPAGDRKALGRQVGQLIREQGGLRPHHRVAATWRRRDERPPPPPEPEQLSLL